MRRQDDLGDGAKSFRGCRLAAHYGRAAGDGPRVVESNGTERLTRLSRERGHSADAGCSTNIASPLSLPTYQRSGSAPFSSNTRQHDTSLHNVRIVESPSTRRFT